MKKMNENTFISQQISKLEKLIKKARKLLKKFPNDDFLKISIRQSVYKIKELRGGRK